MHVLPLRVLLLSVIFGRIRTGIGTRSHTRFSHHFWHCANTTAVSIETTGYRHIRPK